MPRTTGSRAAMRRTAKERGGSRTTSSRRGPRTTAGRVIPPATNGRFANGGRCWVRLTPRGGRDAFEGVDDDGVLRVRVRAAPVEGAANTALLRLLADVLHVAARELTIEAGAASRNKRLLLGPDAAERMTVHFPGARVEPVPIAGGTRGT